MKKFLLAAGIFGVCAAASAQTAPNQAQATQALQEAMQREIQGMQAGGSASGMDSQTATGVANSLQVKSIDNCKPAGNQVVACDVRTTANVKGTPHEGVNTYHFYQQAGKWQARLPSGS